MATSLTPSVSSRSSFLPAPTSASLIHGESAWSTALRSRLRTLAPFFRGAMIHGEAGTGKQQIARELHRLRCPNKPFLVLSPKEGSTDFPALLRSARGGVVFLREIGDLARPAQAAILVALQSRDWADCPEIGRPKLIASTSADPKLLVTTGRLHPRLYDWLTSVDIRVPPLRERADDIPELLESFLAEAAWTGVQHPAVSSGSLQQLKARSWPGNITQLRSVALLSLREGHEPRLLTLDEPSSPAAGDAVQPEEQPMRLEDMVQAHVCKVLGLCGGNKLRTAELLGVSRSTLYRMLEEMAAAKAK